MTHQQQLVAALRHIADMVEQLPPETDVELVEELDEDYDVAKDLGPDHVPGDRPGNYRYTLRVPGLPYPWLARRERELFLAEARSERN